MYFIEKEDGIVLLSGNLRMAGQNAVEVADVESQKPFILEIEVQHVVPALPVYEKGLDLLIEEI